MLNSLAKGRDFPDRSGKKQQVAHHIVRVKTVFNVFLFNLKQCVVPAANGARFTKLTTVRKVTDCSYFFTFWVKNFQFQNTDYSNRSNDRHSTFACSHAVYTKDYAGLT